MISLKNIPALALKWRDWPSRCSNPDCSGQRLLHAVTRSRHGIQLANSWYCGADCFQSAVVARIEELNASPARPARKHNSRLPLGLLLHSRGILTQDQLLRALQLQRASGSDFGEAVQQLGFATAEQVTAAVAAQWSCPVFALGERPLAVQVRIPKQFMELYEMLPVHSSEKGGQILVGFVSGVQYQFVYTIEHITGYKVQPCFITRRDYERSVHATSMAGSQENELTFEQSMTFAEMARIIRNYAVQLGGNKARIGRCRNYLWARIWGRTTEMDLVFRFPD